MMMPEATVDEYGPGIPSVRDVRRSGQIPIPGAETESYGVKCSANCELRSGIDARKGSEAPGRRCVYNQLLAGMASSHRAFLARDAAADRLFMNFS